MFNKIKNHRRLFHVFIAGLIFAAISVFDVKILYVVIPGIILGSFKKRVFCRWVCPIGLLLETLMKVPFLPKSFIPKIYQLHAHLCPVTWSNELISKLTSNKNKPQIFSNPDVKISYKNKESEKAYKEQTSNTASNIK